MAPYIGKLHVNEEESAGQIVSFRGSDGAVYFYPQQAVHQENFHIVSMNQPFTQWTNGLRHFNSSCYNNCTCLGADWDRNQCFYQGTLPFPSMPHPQQLYPQQHQSFLQMSLLNHMAPICVSTEPVYPIRLHNLQSISYVPPPPPSGETPLLQSNVNQLPHSPSVPALHTLPVTPEFLLIVPTRANQDPRELSYIWNQKFSKCFSQFPDQWHLIPVHSSMSESDIANKCADLGQSRESWNKRPKPEYAKVRFTCNKCGNDWTSYRGAMVFYYKLLNRSDERIGYVMFKLFGQQCSKCPSRDFQYAMWYHEEVDRVIHNIGCEVGQHYYQSTFKRRPHNTMPKRLSTNSNRIKAHESNGCQACVLGICSSFTRRRANNNTFPVSDSSGSAQGNNDASILESSDAEAAGQAEAE